MQSVFKTRLFAAVLALLITAAGVVLFLSWPQPDTDQQSAAQILLDGVEIDVLVSDTVEERVQGLSGSKPFGSNGQGMLFVFDEEGIHGIWMKDMLFSLDIGWLDSSGKVVHIETGISPDSFPTVFEPAENARYVVEMNAGAFDEIDLSTDSTLDILLN